jgi:hypothetical protein
MSKQLKELEAVKHDASNKEVAQYAEIARLKDMHTVHLEDMKDVERRLAVMERENERLRQESSQKRGDPATVDIQHQLQEKVTALQDKAMDQEDKFLLLNEALLTAKLREDDVASHLQTQLSEKEQEITTQKESLEAATKEILEAAKECQKKDEELTMLKQKLNSAERIKTDLSIVHSTHLQRKAELSALREEVGESESWSIKS